MKKLFEFKTKTIVATGLGAALFTLLFMYVKIPTGIPETDIQTADRIRHRRVFRRSVRTDRGRTDCIHRTCAV